jgi:hypothetical protein
MNIEDLTIKQARELSEMFNNGKCENKKSDDSHWEIGKAYLIRTVTMIQVGKLEKVTDKELILSSAAWIADTGRFSESLLTGNFDEVEMFSHIHNLIVNRGALCDAQRVDFEIKNLKTK